MTQADAGAEAGGGEREREWEWNGNGNGNGNGRQRRTVSDGRVGQERTTSDGRVRQRDGHRRTDVSDRETDSVGRICRIGTDNIRGTCRTERRTVSNGRVGQRLVALDKRRRYGDTVETEETEETGTRLIFRIEYKRLHEEKKKTKHGRHPPYIHSSRNSHTSSYSYPRNSHMYSYSHMCS